MATSIAAGIAVLLGGTAAWALTSDQQGNKPTIDVTATDPTTAPVPTTATPATTNAATAAPLLPRPPLRRRPRLRPRRRPRAHLLPSRGRPAPRIRPPPPRRRAPPRPPRSRAAACPRASDTTPPRSRRSHHRRTASNPPSNAVGFAASAAYGSCSEDPPYDIYSGTAEPGTRISITSLYGSGTATADEHGHWEKKVVFAGSPLDEAFDGDGQLSAGLRHLQLHPHRVNGSVRASTARLARTGPFTLSDWRARRSLRSHWRARRPLRFLLAPRAPRRWSFPRRAAGPAPSLQALMPETGDHQPRWATASISMR